MRQHGLSPWMRRVALREWLLLCAALLALAIALGMHNGLGRLDQTLYDLFVSADGRPARDDILIVAIDDYSLAQLGRWPWSRSLHAQLLDRINAGHPRAIGLDLILTERQRATADANDRGDAALQAALLHSRFTVLPVIDAYTGDGALVLPPVPELANAAQSLAHIDLQHDSDGVVRSVLLRKRQGTQSWPQFALALAQPASGWMTASAHMNGGEPAFHIPYAGNSGHFRSIPYVAVLRGEVPPQFFKDKYVLVGATAPGLGDAYPTPVSGRAGAMPGIEIHANILAALLDHRSITPAAPWQAALFSALPVACALLAYLLLAPHIALAAFMLLTLATAGASFIALRLGIWLAPSAALVALIVSYPLWSWRRLEAAIAYLGQEFARLDREPHLLPEAPARSRAPVADVLERHIDAMKTAARRVRDLRQFVSDSLDSLPDATLVTTLDGRILLANRHAHAFFGGSDGAALQQRAFADAMARLQSPQPVDAHGASRFRWSDLLDPLQAAALAAGVSATDAHGRDLLVKSAACYSAENALIGWIVSVIDISPVRAAERSRDETLRFLSHDMRAPQASILALLELQADPASAVPVPDFFARIEKAARKTLGLADNFVQLARAESQEYRFDDADFQDLLLDATDEMWTLAGSKQIRIITEIDGDEFPLHADRPLLTRALVNLLSNAINYSPEKTVIRCFLCHQKQDGRPPQIVCRISDQGYGIATEDQARLFHRFQRVGTPDQPRQDGAGLGLVFVKTVVERHAGTISVVSAPAQGSTFAITLPMATLPDATASA